MTADVKAAEAVVIMIDFMATQSRLMTTICPIEIESNEPTTTGMLKTTQTVTDEIHVSQRKAMKVKENRRRFWSFAR